MLCLLPISLLGVWLWIFWLVFLLISCTTKLVEMNSRYDQTDAKVKYNLQFGIALYCKEQLIYDVSRCPFTLKINESTNRLSDKQYDGYVQYLSESERKVLNKFCGSLFLRYCTHDDLVDHFTQFLVDSEFEPNYFFHFR